MSLIDATPLNRNRPAQITRTGRFYDPRYGDFEITPAQLDEMIRNFNQKVLGIDIFIDVAHHPENGSAGRITRIWRDGDRLMADVEWTPYGLISMEEKGFCYLSMEYDENYQDNETKIRYSCVLRGAGLTIRPVIKRLEKVQLSELDDLRSALAATGCAIPAQSCLVENYIALAEILPTATARMDMAARFVMMAEALPKAPPAPARLSERRVAEIAARWIQETEKEQREARAARWDSRKAAIEAFLADTELRWWRSIPQNGLTELRALADRRFNVDASDADFSRLMAELKETRSRISASVIQRRMAAPVGSPDVWKW